MLDRYVAENSSVALLWDSDPFGVASPNENPSGAGEFKFNLRFPGQYADAETGLNYNYFRDYNPKTGRYVQSDPIGLEGGTNTYGYVYSSPLSFVDPLGLETELCKRPFYPFPSPIARHCFVRFDQNDKDTLSFDSTGVHQDLAASKSYWPKSCTETHGNEADDCVRTEMNKCNAEDYDFTGFNCCHCAEQALKTCGLTVPVSWWPNWPINPGPQPEEISKPTFVLVP